MITYSPASSSFLICSIVENCIKSALLPKKTYTAKKKKFLFQYRIIITLLKIRISQLIQMPVCLQLIQINIYKLSTFIFLVISYFIVRTYFIHIFLDSVFMFSFFILSHLFTFRRLKSGLLHKCMK